MAAVDFLPGELRSRVAATIGLVSDTHMPERLAVLPPPLFDALAGVDLLLHAGDVGELRVLDELSAIGPVVAVHGNDETAEAQRQLPYQQVIAVAGRRILLWHSHFPDWEQEWASRQSDEILLKLDRSIDRARTAGASIAVFGHWHIPLVHRGRGVTVINPGALASGNEFSRQRHQTVAILYLLTDGTQRVVHVDLTAARPQPLNVDVDWDAGFRSALARYSDTILDPALVALVPRLRAKLTPAQLTALRTLVLPLAHRCWAGELETIDVALLQKTVRETDGVDEEIRAAVLAHEE